VEDEEPSQFCKQCRLKLSMDQSWYFDLLGRQRSFKICNSTWMC